MRWFTNLKTQNKLLLAFGILALVGAVTTGWSMVNVVRLQEQIGQVEQETSALVEAAKAQGYFLRRWIDSKNYLLTDDEYFAGQYQRYDEQLDTYLHRAHLSTGVTDKNEDLTTLGQNLRDYTAAVAAIETAYQTGNADQALTVQRSLDEADGKASAVQAQIEVMFSNVIWPCRRWGNRCASKCETHSSWGSARWYFSPSWSSDRRPSQTRSPSR